jgi:hypothetical protein
MTAPHNSSSDLDAPAIGGGRASPEIRADLLAGIAAPLGAVAVARRATPTGDVLVVRTTAAGSVAEDRRVSRFHGFAVIWETVRPPRIGRGGEPRR